MMPTPAMAMHRGLLPAAAILLPLAIISPSQAERDGNAPWGDKSPPKGFHMWWSDPSNVIEDLDQFQSLYIKVHGCIWSEFGIDNFDDDGENRDGDEEWYQGRTQPFRANAAYSLYGVLKGQFRIGKCTKSTYINTFVTNMGADTILNILNRDNYVDYDDDGGYGYGHASCVASYDEYRDRDLGSGDNNNNGNQKTTTMGCSLTSDDFVMATFDDPYCDGNYFANTTDLMKSYNHAIKRVNCEKIYPYGNADGDLLLQTSSPCDNNFYQSRCPDPYGLKKRYALMVSGGSRRKWINPLLQRTSRFFSWVALVVGVLLLCVSMYYKRRYGKKWRRKKRRKSKSRRSSSSRKIRGSRSGGSILSASTSGSRSRSRRKERDRDREYQERGSEDEGLPEDDTIPDVTSALSGKSSKSGRSSSSKRQSKSSSSSGRKKKSSSSKKESRRQKYGFRSEEEANKTVSGVGEIV